MTKHTIKMVEKETGTEVIYNGVTWVDYHFGCEMVLHFDDESTATFDMANWEIWDLTPHKGWNGNIN